MPVPENGGAENAGPENAGLECAAQNVRTVKDISQ